MRKLGCVLLLLTLGACASNVEFAAYVRAHRAKYNQTAPHYTQLIEQFMPEDTDIQKAQKEAKLKLIEAEGEMITEAEKLFAGPK